MAIKPAAFPTMSGSRRRLRRSVIQPDMPHLRRLVTDAKIELIPMKSLEHARTELRPNSSISMTCSPAKGIDATLDESERLVAAGHRVTPHIAKSCAPRAIRKHFVHAEHRQRRIHNISSL